MAVVPHRAPPAAAGSTSGGKRSIEQWQKVALREGREGRLELQGVKVYTPANEQQALNLLFLGWMNRSMAETAMNQASSRSHCVLTISLEQRRADSDVVRSSRLHLVDLAGSERVGKSASDRPGSAITRREGRHINLSLHHLEQVIVALHERERDKRRHVPFRNCVLTSLLRDSLGGNCLTAFIMTINAERRHCDETISTCRFAQRCSQLTFDVDVNEERDLGVVVARLEREKAALLAQIEAIRARKGGARPGESGSGGAAPVHPFLTLRPIGEEDRRRCEDLVARYLRDDLAIEDMHWTPGLMAPFVSSRDRSKRGTGTIGTTGAIEAGRPASGSSTPRSSSGRSMASKGSRRSSRAGAAAGRMGTGNGADSLGRSAAAAGMQDDLEHRMARRIGGERVRISRGTEGDSPSPSRSRGTSARNSPSRRVHRGRGMPVVSATVSLADMVAGTDGADADGGRSKGGQSSRASSGSPEEYSQEHRGLHRGSRKSSPSSPSSAPSGRRFRFDDGGVLGHDGDNLQQVRADFQDFDQDLDAAGSNGQPASRGVHSS